MSGDKATEPSGQLRADTCPLCGQDNRCAIEQGEKIDACWCYRASIPQELRQQIPDSLHGKSCVCPVCAERYRQTASVSGAGKQAEAGTLAGAFSELDVYTEKMRQVNGASAGAVLVFLEGRFIHEAYRGAHTCGSPDVRPTDARSRFNVASVRKSFLGLLVAWALHDGLIGSVDDPVTRYFDEPGGDGAGMLQGTTIRHLLTHTHGMQASGTRLFPPGSSWSYNNTGVNLLITLIGRLYGKPLAHILKERVFGPCGFTATGFETRQSDELIWLDESYADDEGRSANLFMNARELALWGALHLDEGVLGGKRIVPATVVRQATALATPPGLDETWPRNGFFWQVQAQPCTRSELGEELPAGSYQILGLTGCALLVIPAARTVAVRMYNQTTPNPPGYSYLEDIRAFGNSVLRAVRKLDS
ncbi:cysteine-rich CWC family protein [Paenibacillus puerhi]|uniref:cysteine-rich CWC family protein n=1 Tax=Paenibacillus puerhi TaxID=2692622 RepID=UPI00135C2A90|nr:cysteine-rich CWC family protein [Paenibacillus puerhi]